MLLSPNLSLVDLGLLSLSSLLIDPILFGPLNP